MNHFVIGQAVSFRTAGPLGLGEIRYGIVQGVNPTTKGVFYVVREDGEPKPEKVVKVRAGTMEAR